MKKWPILLLLLCTSCFLFGQLAMNSTPLAYPAPDQQQSVTEKRPRTKPVMYNTLGGSVQLGPRDIVVGGTSLAYKKFGTFLSYKLGILNFMLPEKGEMGEFTYENLRNDTLIGYITGNRQGATTFMLSGGITVPITRRIPLYFGMGFTRYKVLFEYYNKFEKKTLWNIDTDNSRWELNYTAGVMVPLGRFLINVGYDHFPQSVFIGIGISGRYVYEDVDEWWWGARKRERSYQ